MRATDIDTFVEIELYQDTAFVSGTKLQGTVHLHAKDVVNDVQ